VSGGAWDEWVERTIGGRITGVERTPSGGSRETYFYDVERPGGEVVQTVLRIEAGGSFTGTDINVAKEAAVYRALGPTDVPVPEVHGVAPEGAAVLLSKLAGRPDLGDTPEEHVETLVDFADVLGRLHRLDVDQLDLPGFDRPRSVEDHARLDLLRWQQRAATGVPDLDPLARYAGAWLIAHPPTSVARTSFVHGDCGPGNFMADRGKVTGLIDVEFSHIGDPMDDLAWVHMRGGGRSMDLEPFFARYRETSGIPVDEANVDYYQLAVQYRCAITTSLAVARGGGARGWPPYLLVTQRYLRAVAQWLSTLTGVQEPELDLGLADTTRTRMYDALLDALRGAVKGIDDPDLQEDTRNHQILVHYLRGWDRGHEALDADDRDDRQATFGTADEAAAFDGRLEEAGAAGDEAVLRYLLRRQQRIASAWATLLDRPRRR
jgi:aminoglycoside phosphotransferase (APT) family kinase protein